MSQQTLDLTKYANLTPGQLQVKAAELRNSAFAAGTTPAQKKDLLAESKAVRNMAQGAGQQGTASFR